jgi:hypothetical protein
MGCAGELVRVVKRGDDAERCQKVACHYDGSEMRCVHFGRHEGIKNLRI